VVTVDLVLRRYDVCTRSACWEKQAGNREVLLEACGFVHVGYVHADSAVA